MQFSGSPGSVMLTGSSGSEGEGSATIPNHVDGSRNHLESMVESLLESGNQVEILESRIIISMFILGYLVFLLIIYEYCDA